MLNTLKKLITGKPYLTPEERVELVKKYYKSRNEWERQEIAEILKEDKGPKYPKRMKKKAAKVWEKLKKEGVIKEDR